MRGDRQCASKQTGHITLKQTRSAALAGMGCLAGGGGDAGPCPGGSRSTGGPVRGPCQIHLRGNTSVTSAQAVTGDELAVPGKPKVADLPEFCRVVASAGRRPTPTSTSRSGCRPRPGTAAPSRAAKAVLPARSTIRAPASTAASTRSCGAATSPRPPTRGHSSTDKFWAVGHPERVIDYAYRAKHLVDRGREGTDRDLLRAPGGLFRISAAARTAAGKP